MEEMDLISDLPVFILHKILSHLPREDSARTSALSKRWNSLWNSFPVFEFHQNNYMNRFSGEDFLRFVDKSLQNFVDQNNKFRMEKLDLVLDMYYIDGDSVSMIDSWLLLALRNGVSDLGLTVYRDDYHLPETTFASSESFRFLRKFELFQVCISEKIIGDICHNCPHITHLQLWNIRGLKTLEISKLDQLESLKVEIPRFCHEMERVSVDAASLKRFSFVSHTGRLHCAIYLNSCCDLKQLCVANCAITDDLLHSYLSRFSLIEDLQIFRCHLLRRIRISLQRLKRLYLCFRDVEAIQLDAPALSKFYYTAVTDLPLLSLENTIPCAMDFTYKLYATNGQVDSFSFLKLREFLRVPIWAIDFVLCFEEYKLSFDPEELTESVIPPVVEVDRLELISLKISDPLDWATLIEGVLWSCHPKTISICADDEFGNNCIKVLCEKLLQSEYQLCCNSSSNHLKCWRHSLKGASVESIGEKKFTKIDSVGGIEDKQLQHVLDTVSSLQDDDEVRFRLNWHH